MGSTIIGAMRSAPTQAVIKAFAVLQASLLAGGITATALAETKTCTTDADARKWTVTGAAADNSDISGAACAPDGRCLLVSDEKRRAWFFRIDESSPAMPKLVSGDKIKLDPAKGTDEADAEGAAFDGGRFYAVGSHGTSRYKNEFQASRYSVYQIEPGGHVEASGALAGLLATVPGIAEHFCTKATERCESLQDGGMNIEGLAARGGNLYVGFRSPAPSGKAFILRVAENAIFGHGDRHLETIRVELGQDASGRDLGIRDLAVVADGLLILAGPSLPEGDDAVGSGQIFHWRETDGELRPLRKLKVEKSGVKPEVLLLLSETPADYRALVICDGPTGGSPMEYQIQKQ